ncbi:uncharacterized protein CANTADRAFT_45936 [Suhomyces tanzawaensis NRRL Y-17324]|uniref:Uncharacterized protein n=1 Tax=Suhomyces tanzawaensis NRRL Y-17324 TaxID=984487 RepID=A0A1E4SPE1_9ASCO|nr:uncharacterized protein CANTADRAFT_45936 [Suhomyces tanzawaensis NRRL Y-17324]ODV81394.1 hypothetical protein CANTADRAFT_45936 [Suhomyces tanzawaensis NRRL Y-17324]
MKFAKVLVSSLATMASFVSALEPASDQIEVFPSEYSYILDLVNDYVSEDSLTKRDGALSIEAILTAVSKSGLISNTIDEVAGSPALMNTISQTLINVINGTNISALENGESNLPVNVTQLLDSLDRSGLVHSTLNLLLVNETNRHDLAVWSGKLLCAQPSVAKILVDLGNGQKLTWKYLHDVIVNTKAKVPNTVGPTLKSQVVFGGDELVKRAGNSSNQYAGSAAAFLNNIIGTVVQSQIFTSTIDNTFVALNNSGVIAPITLEVLNNPNLGVIASNIAPAVYDSGVLDKIDLNKYYSLAKKKKILADGVQVMLTNPTYSPYLALFFKQMDDSGVYKQVQENLFGPQKN